MINKEWYKLVPKWKQEDPRLLRKIAKLEAREKKLNKELSALKVQANLTGGQTGDTYKGS
jgi:hypothetical protein